jgi:glycosyltransferase involved in cell wall biosynthesis
MPERPVRVAILGTRGYPSYYGGFETAVRMLAPHLCDQGFDVTVYSRPGDVRLDDPARDVRVAVEFTPGLDGKSLSTLTYGLTSVWRAARSRPDVVLVMNVANGFWLPLLRLRGIPTVVNVDGLEWLREKWGWLARKVFYAGARATARWATEIVCDAHAIAQVWRDEFGRESHFIPYGGRAMPELPVPDGLPDRGYVLVVSRFVPENTIVEFFEAARLIAKHHPVVVVGSTGHGGELDDRARELAGEEPGVQVVGHVADDRRLFSLWQHAGAYFHGHTVGGTNPALVQAMALGAPVVARDTVFNREVLGPEGRYVGADPARIAEAVLAVLDDPREADRLRSLSRDRVADDYTVDLVNERYATVLRDLAARLSRRG